MNNVDTGLDQHARSLHEASLQHISPRVQAQLVQRRRAALQGTPNRAGRFLPWAGMATAAVALAFALQLRPPVRVPVSDEAAPATPVDERIAALDTVQTDSDPATLLSEDPEFYLWLAENGRTELE